MIVTARVINFMKFIIIILFGIGASRAESQDDVSTIAERIIRLPPEVSSAEVLGYDAKIYRNIGFWSEYQREHLIGTSSTELIPGKLVAVTVLYSVSGKINAPSIGSKILLLVSSKAGWKAIPAQYLKDYLEKGEEAAMIRMMRDHDEIPGDDESFKRDLARILSEQRQVELEQEKAISNILREKGVPLDRVVNPPKESIGVPVK